MSVRSASYSLVIVALAFASMGGDCTLDGGPLDRALPPVNALCTRATPVTDGTSVTVQDTSAGSDTLGSACQPLAAGPVLYYKATIPAGATLTGRTSGPTSLRILPGCGAATCLASDVAKSSGGGVTVALTNVTSSPLDVILAAGSSNAVDPGAFGLTISIK